MRRVAAFGIGTFFTNDFRSLSSGGQEKSKALNIVIKMASINGLPCVKISDDLTKVRVPPLSSRENDLPLFRTPGIRRPYCGSKTFSIFPSRERPIDSFCSLLRSALSLA